MAGFQVGPSQRDPQALRNPILDEIDNAAQNAHAQLSPQAQAALAKAGAPLPGQATPAGPQPTIATPRAAPPSIAPVPQSPQEQAAGAEVARLTAPPPSNPALVHTHANTGTAGVNQIKSPWARIPLQIASAVGETFAPRLAAALPGTESHHQMLVNQAENALKTQQGERESQQKTQLQSAEANEANARAYELENKSQSPTNAIELFLKDPAAFKQYQEAIAKASATKEPQFVKDGEGNLVGMVDGQGRIHSATDPNLDPQAKAIMDAAKPKTPAIPEGERPLGERVAQLNQMLTARYQVLHPKTALPAQYQIPPNATQKDYDRIDKGLEAEERATGTREQQAQTAEMRRQTLALAQSNAANRQDVAVKSAGLKAYTPALESAERFNVMAKNYEDAVKNHDQQAMLSLLANHLGMTMGLQKGSRLTKDVYHEAERSRPWLQGAQARFDSDGYLSGVVLTVPQMQQMINLGRERFSEDVSKGHSESAYMGVQDAGPARIPNRATINHYTALANGDPAKAKQLAAADGWTVQ